MRLGLRSVDAARLTKYFPFVLKLKDKVNLEPGSPDLASVTGLSPRALVNFWPVQDRTRRFPEPGC